MKHTPYLFFFLILVYTSFAQIPDGSIAPDFTVVDIDGNSHNLYSYLDAGKVCILNFSASWSSTCATYHSSEALHDVYTALGPQGSDEVVVLFIEGDSVTTVQDLMGLTVGSSGFDFTANTTFPIINAHSIREMYNVLSYPTIFTICHDKLVRQTGQLLSQDHINFVNNDCPYLTGSNNVSINNFIVSDDICSIDSTITLIQNLGSSNLTSADFTVSANGIAIDSFSFNGNLAPFQFDTIFFQSNTPIFDTSVFEINAFNPNGNVDTDLSDNSASKSYVLKNLTGINSLELKIVTDEYSYETYWHLIDQNDSIFIKGGNTLFQLLHLDPQLNNGYTPNSTNYESLDLSILPDGCYKLVMFDFWGDGICCNYGNGSIEISDNLGHTYATVSEFGVRYEFSFVNDFSTAFQVNAIANLEIYPNPSQGFLYIKTEFAYENIELINLQGKILKTINGLQTQIDLSDFDSGVYVLKLIKGKEILTKKIVLSK